MPAFCYILSAGMMPGKSSSRGNCGVSCRAQGIQTEHRDRRQARIGAQINWDANGDRLG